MPVESLQTLEAIWLPRALNLSLDIVRPDRATSLGISFDPPRARYEGR